MCLKMTFISLMIMFLRETSVLFPVLAKQNGLPWSFHMFSLYSEGIAYAAVISYLYVHTFGHTKCYEITPSSDYKRNNVLTPYSRAFTESWLNSVYPNHGLNKTAWFCFVENNKTGRKVHVNMCAAYHQATQRAKSNAVSPGIINRSEYQKISIDSND